MPNTRGGRCAPPAGGAVLLAPDDVAGGAGAGRVGGGGEEARADSAGRRSAPSRPHVSNDNPFSEAQFETLKYRPAFPDRFGSIQDARAHGHAFFPWYNNEHYHSGLGLLTPADVYHGLAEQRVVTRATVLATAYAAHPERFPAGPPHPPAPPVEVWINPPKVSVPSYTSSATRPSPLAHAAAFA